MLAVTGLQIDPYSYLERLKDPAKPYFPTPHPVGAQFPHLGEIQWISSTSSHTECDINAALH